MYRSGHRLRLAELLASLSLATDLGTGQPLGHGLRTCALAMMMAQELGCSVDIMRSVYQVSLLRFLGCTADAAETAHMVGGDDIGFNAAMAPVFLGGSAESLQTMLRTVGGSDSPLKRARLVTGVLTDLGGPAAGLTAHCEVAAMLARRLELDQSVITALQHAYERWDGKGYPAGLDGEDIPIEIRIVSVARDADLLLHRNGDALEVLKRRRGKSYDPVVVDAFGSIRSGPVEADWEMVMEAEPQPAAFVDDLDLALSVAADFVDLKSPWTRGHSRKVADLASTAALELGLDVDEVRMAALVHDLGRVGVENGVWDKRGPLAIDDWEKVRLHPYLTQRILSRCPGMAALGELASSHHERLDGSGYHRQTSADGLARPARILAAADVLAALLSPRPYRDALNMDEASSVLDDEARLGRLDPVAVGQVVTAAGGHLQPTATVNPDGLTDREVEVLVLMAGGSTNRRMADDLFISPKTVGRHVENIYAKIGVSTRAAAAVYAMEHRLLK